MSAVVLSRPLLSSLLREICAKVFVMAWVEKQQRRKGVVFLVRYRDPSGRQRSRTFSRKSDADRYARAVETDKERGAWHDVTLGRRSFEEWAEQWLADAVTPTKKPSTLAHYRSLLDCHLLPEFGRVAVAGILPSAVQSWVARLSAQGLAASSVRGAHGVLSQILERAVRDGAIPRNPAYRLSLPRIVRKEARYFDPLTVEAIAEAVPEPYAVVIRLLGTTGLRWGELVALRRRHVDVLRRRLLVELNAPTVNGKLVEGPPKANKSRTVPLTRTMSEALALHLAGRSLDPDLHVFVNAHDRPLRYQRFVESVWRPALESLGVPRAGLHSLRHSAAAALDAAGASPKAIQSILGHSSAGYTLTVYSHLFDESLDGIGERLEELHRRAVERPALASVHNITAQLAPGSSLD